MRCKWCVIHARKRKQSVIGKFEMVAEKIKWANETRYECLICSYYIAIENDSKAERILRFPKERE
jgi:hypothetical protein